MLTRDVSHGGVLLLGGAHLREAPTRSLAMDLNLLSRVKSGLEELEVGTGGCGGGTAGRRGDDTRYMYTCCGGVSDCASVIWPLQVRILIQFRALPGIGDGMDPRFAGSSQPTSSRLRLGSRPV